MTLVEDLVHVVRRLLAPKPQDPLAQAALRRTPEEIEAARKRNADLLRQRQYDRLYTYEDMHPEERQ